MNRPILAQSFTINGTNSTINGPLVGIVTLGDVVNKLLPFVLAIGGIALFIILILGGYDVLMSQGSPERLKAGRAKITAALIGFILLVSSYFITQLLNFIFGVGVGV